MEGIRIANLQDANQILKIYEPYILHTTVTYEYEPIPLEQYEERMKLVMNKHPWLVYEIDDKIVGYAYASDHLERAAFAWDCEVSVYISSEYQNRGIASKLYEALIEIVKLQGYYNVYSLIDYPNDGSMKLHDKFGFTEVGIYKKTAYKQGAWRDLIVLEKQIKEFQGEPSLIVNEWIPLAEVVLIRRDQ